MEMEAATHILCWTASRNDSLITCAINFTDSMSLLQVNGKKESRLARQLQKFKDFCGSTVLDMLESREMTEHTQHTQHAQQYAKQPPEVACISDLRYWGSDTPCRQNAKNTAPKCSEERQVVQIRSALELLQRQQWKVLRAGVKYAFWTELNRINSKDHNPLQMFHELS